MAEIKDVGAMRMIGYPYLPTMMDGNGSFYSAWEEFMNSDAPKQLDAHQTGEKNRTALIVFSPYSFVYYIGSLFPVGTKSFGDFVTFDLPDSKAAVHTEPADTVIYQIGVNQGIERLMKQFTEAELKIPKHLALTSHPYLVQRWGLDDQSQVQNHSGIMYIGEEQDSQPDEYDD
ncbi:hypothetical protein [Schleiferilactobacillus perolens]|jgi:hypothetical protein|uniref:hypothetical protein n=1 Tax=Schleiferilactobacillus perolens TaxID=100468 RepID=UPI002357ADDD|nr:hypothetical protein [Schleiferilactobacillus perolens]MCI1892462.1 hypothetical protein [Schleiferilactobacillus harbinensis]MCI1911593.1 hypothetical protein [Schleiferilactobacillus harbinensis]MCI2170303.1 hypothetical protein [Schleiferilactobacillus perolens]